VAWLALQSHVFGECLRRHFFEPFDNFELLSRPKDDEAWDAHSLVQPAGPAMIEVGDQWWMYYKGSRGGNVWNGVGALGIAVWRKHGFAYMTTLDRSRAARFAAEDVEVPENTTAMTVNAMVPDDGRMNLHLTAGTETFHGTVAPGDGTALPVQWDRAVPWPKFAGEKVRFAAQLAGAPQHIRSYAWRFVT